MVKLTAKQLEVVNLVWRAEVAGLPTTGREIARTLRVCRNGVWARLQGARKRGAMTWTQGGLRTQRLAGPPIFAGNPPRIVGVAGDSLERHDAREISLSSAKR
jgi:hypothetical protein